ncbi:hypothetical protein VTJ83DRAFT_6571 [Remersonia thermophila]|uniref:HIT-type domain-containing protein n=1 Tax=Remersonia thermophila TaxID=72144 RepID=A0ABR4D539_9PEZI
MPDPESDPSHGEGPSELASANAAELPADHDSEPSPPPPKRPEPKLCGVCNAQPAKYKCPRCTLPYCSVPCSKQHKENHPPDPPKPAAPTTNPSPPTDQPSQSADNDPYSILLDHRRAFEHLFARYPSLPATLSRIHEATLPPSESTPPSRLAGPGRFHNRHGQPQQPQHHHHHHHQQQQQQPWTMEAGLRKGAEALRKARTDPTETGDGVREFCELVRHLLNQKREGVEKVREEVAAEEARIVEMLLREEGG